MPQRAAERIGSTASQELGPFTHRTDLRPCGASPSVPRNRYLAPQAQNKKGGTYSFQSWSVRR